MKVLLLINSNFSGHSTSEHLLEAIIKQLALGGNTVHVIQMLKEKDVLSLPDTFKELQVTTESVNIESQDKTNFVARYIGATRNYLRCRNALKKHKDYDAVFLQSTNVAGIAVWLVRTYLKNTIITYNVQDIFPYNLAYSGKLKKNGVVFKILAAIQRYGYRHSDHIITISEDMKDTLVKDGTPDDKIKVIYNWSYQDESYDQGKLDMTVPDRLFNKRYFNVVYAGNIGVMQNVDILVEAARLMMDDKDVWFHIIGNGVYKDKLEARAKEYGITNISFWPMQSPEFAPSIYSAADVNVIPLVKDVYRTALPSKTATCLACQKPIIFAIGKGSKFGQRVMKEAGCIVTESDRAEELVWAIRTVQNGGECYEHGEFFLDNCRRTSNSALYSKIITETDKSHYHSNSRPNYN